MKNLFYVLLVELLFNFLSYSQNPLWVVPPFAVNPQTSYSTPLPIPATIALPGQNPFPNNLYDPFDGYDGKTTKYSSNGISKIGGGIKFFVIDGFIYDEKGQYICYAWQKTSYANVIWDNSGNYSYDGNGGAETIIIPHPTDCEKFILVGSNETNSSQKISEPVYAIFDYSNGQIVDGGPWYSNYDIDYSTNAVSEIINANTFWPNGDTQIAGAPWGDGTHGVGSVSFACTNIQTDGSRYIIACLGTRLVILKLLSNGTLVPWKRYAVPYPNNYGNDISYPNDQYYRSELELYENAALGTFSLAFCKRTTFSSQNANVIQIMDFNSNFTSVLSSTSPVVLYSNSSGPANVKGIEFSPNGNKVYFTTTSNGTVPSELNYIDRITSGVYSLGVSNSLPIEFGYIEKDKNNNILVASPNGLYRLTNPNNPISTNFSTFPFLSFVIPPSFNHTLSNLQGNYNIGYNLPDQIDNMDYDAIFANNTTCCIDNKSYDKETFSAVASGTWQPGLGSNPIASTSSSTVYIKNELRIPAGRTITIKNMTFKFAPGARVIVENGIGNGAGGKLILDGTIFTNDATCANQMWQGVEVWGNTNATQLAPSQGRLTLTNNSSIQNAQIGILVSKRAVPMSTTFFNNSNNGGIVQCLHSSLINNRFGVYFAKYLPSSNPLNNYSYFINTKFEWIQSASYPFPTNSAPYAHVFLTSVRSINFKGCDFTLSNSMLPNNYSIGYGILSRNAQFSVNNYCPNAGPTSTTCTNADHSNFVNLAFGIYTQNSDNLTYTVNESYFDNCQFGIYSYGTQKERITKNDFKVRELSNVQTAGIALYYSTGYKVEENVFEERDNPAVAHGAGKSYGIVVNSSGVLHNEIYKNTFLNLKIGGQSELINGMGTPTAYNSPVGGLQWKCNVFKTDIYQTDLGVAGTIDYQQGYYSSTSLQDAINKSARNEFSMFNENTSFYPTHDISVSQNSQQFQYIHVLNNLETPDNFNASKVTVAPAQYNANFITSSTNGCPSIVNQPILALSSKLLSTKEEKLQIIEEMDGASSPEIEELYNQLNFLEAEAFQTRYDIESQLLLDSSLNASLDAYEEFLNYLNDSESKRNLLYSNIAKNELQNEDLRSELESYMTPEELELTIILETLRSDDDIEHTLLNNPYLLDSIMNLAYSTNDEITAAKARVLLTYIDIPIEIVDFLSLDDPTKSMVLNKESAYSQFLVMSPNPTQGNVNFLSKNDELFSKIEVFNLAGMKVLESEFEPTLSKNIQCQKLALGTYIVKISSNGVLLDTLLLNRN